LDDSGYGEGEHFLGVQRVQTDSAGNASFLAAGFEPLPVGSFVTATATDEFGNTSEFSLAKRVEVGDDTDQDGVADLLELGGPNNGDANKDGIPDVDQGNVSSVPIPNTQDLWLSIMTEKMYTLSKVNLRTELDKVIDPPPAGVEFPVGYLSFEARPNAGKAVKIDVKLPSRVKINSYWKYGPTPENPKPHWYRFKYDGLKGAVIENDFLSLYLVDGAFGDNDLLENGVIIDPGAPAWESEIRLMNPKINSEGWLQFQLECTTNQVYRIETSANLKTWTELLRTNVTSSPVGIVDTNAPANLLRFYRAVQLQ
jgi:hypothetical protein